MEPVGGAQGGAPDAPRRSGAPALAWGGRLFAGGVHRLARPLLREARLLRRAPATTVYVWSAAVAGQIRLWLGVEIDQRRHWLWLPVFFGCGVLWFFSRLTPGDAGPSLIAAAAFLFAAATRRQPAARMALVAIAMIPAGYAASALRLSSLQAPVLQRPTVGELTGYVVAVDQRGVGVRLLVAPVSFANLPARQLPRRVRVSLRQITPEHVGPFRAGVMLRGKARLLPPPEAARPGGYDFARDAWFRQIGGSGAVAGSIAVWSDARRAWITEPQTRVGQVKVGQEKAGQTKTGQARAGTADVAGAGEITKPLPPPAPAWSWRLAAWIDNSRMALTGRIADAWGGQAGAVAAALVTGKRGQIAEQTNAWLRAAGIYHIISISGLHMVLAAGMFFWTARAALALSPWCALYLPVRKIAAVLAMAGAAAYCIFSGADVATERALIMILAMLGAILVDRPALSLHNLALAAMIVLIREPESLLGPGFQMSFAAVAGLIVLAGHGSVTPGQPRRRRPEPGVARRVTAPVVEVALATLVCEMATGPFSIWHFQTLYPLGLIGNAMALPFLSLVVMPAAVIGVALTPLGLDWPVWWIMGAATEPVLGVAARIAATPHSIAGVAAPGPGVLLCLSGAIVWFVIWRTPLRWVALAPAMAGLLLIQSATVPDVLADRQGQGALVIQGSGRDAGGRARVTLLGTPSSFVVEQWLRAIGDPRGAADPSLRANARCDPLGCIAVRDDGGAVAWSRERSGLFEDCARADVIVSPHRAPAGCRAPVLLDRPALAEQGAASVYLRDGVATVRRVRVAGESWPWIRQSSPRYQPPPARSFHPEPAQEQKPEAGPDHKPARTQTPEEPPEPAP